MKKTNNKSLLIKNIKYDYIMGIQSQLLLFLPFIIMAIYSCLMLQNELQLDPTIKMGEPNFLNYFIYYFKGIDTIDNLVENEKLIIPVWYLFPNIYLSFLVSRYPENNLKESGIQVITRTKRRDWWLSKFIWSFGVAVIYFVILIVVFLLFSKFKTYEINSVINESLAEISLNLSAQYRIWLVTLIVPTITTMALNSIVLVVSLVSKPFVAMIVNLIIIVSSVYCCSSFFIGNYFMIFRSEINCNFSGGVSSIKGLFINAFIIVVMFLFGKLYINKKDFFN